MIPYHHLDEDSGQQMIPPRIRAYTLCCNFIVCVCFGLGVICAILEQEKCSNILTTTTILESLVTLWGMYLMRLRYISLEKWKKQNRYYFWIDVGALTISTLIYYKYSLCQEETPLVYYSLLTLLILNYLNIFFVLLAIGLLIVCAPFYYFIIRPLTNKKEGLTKQEIQKLPHSIHQNLEPYPCLICLENIYPATEMIQLKCGHCFHIDCVQNWLKVKATCPTCRLSVRNTSVNV